LHAADNGRVGAPRRRNEDRRHLRGQGQFLADIRLQGMRDAVFVRSPVAHGRIVSVQADEAAGRVWTAADLDGVALPIVADAANPAFRSSDYPILAQDKVRFVGEPVAIVLGDDRASAEDAAELVDIDIDPLPVVVDPFSALDDTTTRVHDHWPDNVFVETSADFGDMAAAAAGAAVSVTRKLRMGRQAGVPLETRGCIAYLDRRLDQLVLYSSTQFPHVIRSALAKLLRIEERRLRVVAPDVGGGFGIKNNLYPEEVAICAVALQAGHPVRWIEDRWENMVGSAQARDHAYTMTVHAAADGEILGVDADVLVDSGAYSVWPWTAAMEAGMSAGIIPGPYRIRNYRFRTRTVATNKTPMGPYRGVARPGACFAIERMVDEVAHELGLEPKDVRIRNMIRPDEFPYTSVTGKIYDSGDYAASVVAAAELIDHDAVRAEQKSAAGRFRVGVGYASYTEQTAHGAREWASRGLPVVFGFESATAVLDPSGGLTVRVGIQSHGQGLETTLAQVACEVLGVDPAKVSVVHGDTDTAPYGMGTFASRSMVMAGGATYHACRLLAERIAAVAATILGGEATDYKVVDGKVAGPGGILTFAEVAEVAYLQMQHLPRSVEPALEVTYRYRPTVETGTFSYSTHAAVVSVDLDTGSIRVRDYAVAEDCGTIVNPLIVDGQIHGGVAQGLGTALLEQVVFDEHGQPQATTFLDYLLPGAGEVPFLRIKHLETPSPFTVLGMKGMGEGSAIAPPAAVANAVTDALRDLGVSMYSTPMTPEVVWSALDAVTGPAR
jgi:aerobic carbon-monoxide dehydrogenase large subunit